ncbi:peroxiredoxin-2e chloroplastic, partial [Phtheirospermum japonicum]
SLSYFDSFDELQTVSVSDLTAKKRPASSLSPTRTPPPARRSTSPTSSRKPPSSRPRASTPLPACRSTIHHELSTYNNLEKGI